MEEGLVRSRNTAINLWGGGGTIHCPGWRSSKEEEEEEEEEEGEGEVRLQLDCLSVRSWDHAGIFGCRGPILNPRQVLGSSAQTTRGMLVDFFVKRQNGII